MFLDEVGELPLDMQPKLLRVLEIGEVRRMGENQLRKVDVRVIAATNRQLEREVNQGRFREDLFFRLSVVTARVPLRERKEDIPILIDALLTSLDAMEKRHVFTPEVIESMAAHEWPGNVRELRNFIERRALFDVTGLGGRAEDPAQTGAPRRSLRRRRARALERLDDLVFDGVEGLLDVGEQRLQSAPTWPRC